MAATLLFIHGAFHGAWCWEKLLPLLAEKGLTSHCIDLHRASREADIAACQAEVDRLRDAGSAVIPVGHSLGCFAVAGLEATSLAHAVFLAGPLMGPGTPPIQEAILPALQEALRYHDDGRMSITRDDGRRLFYHDCSEADAAAASARLRPNLNYGGDSRDQRPVWSRVPSTYLVCEHDRVLSPEYQKQVAALCARSESFATGHSPMFCAAEDLAGALLRVVETVEA